MSEETWGYVGTPAYVGLHKVTEMLFQFEQMGIFIFDGNAKIIRIRAIKNPDLGENGCVKECAHISGYPIHKVEEIGPVQIIASI